jgi:hypothetical protein
VPLINKKKGLIARIFCDLGKVFDCVTYGTLLIKLNWYGKTGKANDWLKSYLADRYHMIGIKT